MSEYLIKKETLDNIASIAMDFADSHEAMTPAEIASSLNATKEELTQNLEEQKTVLLASLNTLKEKSPLAMRNSILDRTIASISNNQCTKVGTFTFRGCKLLTSVDLPAVEYIEKGAFQNCSSLTSVNIPSATSIDVWAFNGCSSLSSIELPAVTHLSPDNFSDSLITVLDLPSLVEFINPASLFRGLSTLQAVILRRTEGLVSTQNKRINGCNDLTWIYVPKELIELYKTHTDWLLVANKFRAIEDYPDICGGGIT